MLESRGGLVDLVVADLNRFRRLNEALGHERADLMLPGCAIVAAICSLWPSPMLRVADRGLREGMLRQMRQDLKKQEELSA